MQANRLLQHQNRKLKDKNLSREQMREKAQAMGVRNYGKDLIDIQHQSEQDDISPDGDVRFSPDVEVVRSSNMNINLVNYSKKENSRSPSPIARVIGKANSPKSRSRSKS